MLMAALVGVTARAGAVTLVALLRLLLLLLLQLGRGVVMPMATAVPLST